MSFRTPWRQDAGSQGDFWGWALHGCPQVSLCPPHPTTTGPPAQHHCHGPCLPPQLHCHQPEGNPGARRGGNYQHHHRHDCEHRPPAPQPAPSPACPLSELTHPSQTPSLCFLVLQKANTEQSVSVPWSSAPPRSCATACPLRVTQSQAGVWWHSPALQAAPAWPPPAWGSPLKQGAT